MSLSFTVSLPVVRESKGGPCKCPDDVLREFGELGLLAQEVFVVLTLNTKNAVLDRHLVTIGTLNCSLAHPREVFRPAISDNAASIALAHCHPSGDPTPSAEDVRITRQLVEAGRILEINVVDHIIIGRKGDAGQLDYVSLRESGMVKFSN